jgi:hypothetical protein
MESNESAIWVNYANLQEKNKNKNKRKIGARRIAEIFNKTKISYRCPPLGKTTALRYT